MALREQPADGDEVAGLQRFDRSQDPRVLADDVLGAGQLDRLEARGVPREHLRIHVAQRLDAWLDCGDRRNRSFALRTAHVVFGGLEPPRRVGVADDEDVLGGWQCHRTDLERAAVDEERPPRPSERHSGLVHDPALHANVVVLAPLAEPCNLHPVDAMGREVRRIEHGKRRRQLERGRRRQPGRDREVAGQDAAEPVERQPGGLERPRRRGDVVDPPAAPRRDRIEGELAALTVGQGDRDMPIARRDEREADLEADGCRQHEPEVVVGVLADQVDPPGGADDLDRGRIRGHARFVAAQPLGERLDLERPEAHGTATSSAGSWGGRSRSVAAVSSGSVSLMKAPAPASEPARYLSLVAVRFGG